MLIILGIVIFMVASLFATGGTLLFALLMMSGGRGGAIKLNTDTKERNPFKEEKGDKDV